MSLSLQESNVDEPSDVSIRVVGPSSSASPASAMNGRTSSLVIARQRHRNKRRGHYSLLRHQDRTYEQTFTSIPFEPETDSSPSHSSSSSSPSEGCFELDEDDSSDTDADAGIAVESINIQAQSNTPFIQESSVRSSTPNCHHEQANSTQENGVVYATNTATVVTERTSDGCGSSVNTPKNDICSHKCATEHAVIGALHAQPDGAPQSGHGDAPTELDTNQSTGDAHYLGNIKPAADEQFIQRLDIDCETRLQRRCQRQQQQSQKQPKHSVQSPTRKSAIIDGAVRPVDGAFIAASTVDPTVGTSSAFRGASTPETVERRFGNQKQLNRVIVSHSLVKPCKQHLQSGRVEPKSLIALRRARHSMIEIRRSTRASRHLNHRTKYTTNVQSAKANTANVNTAKWSIIERNANNSLSSNWSIGASALQINKSSHVIMQCSDDETTLLERNANVTEQPRDIDEQLLNVTESIVDDIEPIVSSNGATIVVPSIVSTLASGDDVKPLITSMRVTRIGAVSPIAVQRKSVSPKSTAAPVSIVTQCDKNNSIQLSSESDPFTEHDDSMDNIYDETPELDDLDHCLRITQPIWHLPHVDRATVVHYLQSKPVGVFIVRASSKVSTLALSVRLPAGKGPHIEHYLIEQRPPKTNDSEIVFSLEGSEHEFENILDLVIHYAHCCDELPTPLCLPQVLCPPTPMTNDQRASIASLALLGQEFWQSKIAQLKGTLPKETLTSETLTGTVANTNGHNGNRRLSPCSSTSIGSSTSLSANSLTPTPRPRTSVTSEHNSPTPLISVGSSVTKILNSTNNNNNNNVQNNSPPPPLPPKSFPVGSELFEKPNLPRRLVNDVIVSNADGPPPLPPRPGGKSNSNLHDLLLPLTEIESEMNQVVASLQKEIHDDHSANYVKPKKELSVTSNNNKQEGRISACDIYTQTPLLGDELRVRELDSNRARASSSLSLTSSFYMDPVDALAVVQQVRRRRSARSRYSDPELSSREPSNILGGDYSIFQPGHALGNIQSFDALLEKFRAKFATLESAYGSGGQIRSILMAANERSDSSRAPDGSGFYTIDSNWEWRDCNNSPDECLRLLKVNRESKRSQIESFINAERAAESVPENGNVPEQQRHSKSSVLALQYDNLTKEEVNRMKGQPLPQQQKRRPSSKIDNSFVPKMEEDSIVTIPSSVTQNPKVQSTTTTAAAAVINNNNNNDEFGSLDRTIALLNIDLINFNAFLQAQETETGNGHLKATKKTSHEDDYDRVAEEQLEECHPVRLREDKKRVRAPPQRSSQNTEPVMLSIVENISSYVFELAARKNNTFAMSIDNFIQCTKDSLESSPSVILGYVRQFMNGMKNYLIKHGEAEFGLVVSRERARLRPDQFLNLDSILECALQALVIKPLKSHLYELCVRSYTRDGSVMALQKSVHLIQSRRPEDYGVSGAQLPKIERAMRRLQRAYSPIAKLEQLLQVVSALNGAKSSRHSFSGDALLPALQYAISHCALIYVEVELDYTLGLLHSSVLNGGDGNYYLALWSSAVEALKSMSDVTVTANVKNMSGKKLHSNSLLGNEEGASMIRILIPDELTSSISCKSVPVRRNMTARELCRMIGHTYRIANTETHALYRVRRDGAGDIALAEHESPQSIQIEALSRGEPAPLFAFKRTDAQFLWPTAFASD